MYVESAHSSLRFKWVDSRGLVRGPPVRGKSSVLPAMSRAALCNVQIDWARCACVRGPGGSCWRGTMSAPTLLQQPFYQGKATGTRVNDKVMIMPLLRLKGVATLKLKPFLNWSPFVSPWVILIYHGSILTILFRTLRNIDQWII